MNRDVVPDAPGKQQGFPPGRRLIVVVGIDQYRSWPRLHNAVNDARGARDLFLGLGFEEVVPPLLDEMATGEAIRRLVTDDLSKLRTSDSLVLFFAGHGHTVLSRFEDSQPVKTGYLVPADGDGPHGVVATWLRVDTWLSDVARLPARHILVILDACYSGVALGSLVRWRGAGPTSSRSLESLQRRRSRRVITSALDDQRAMDGGPVPGHSLFTGCLIEGLTWGLVQHGRTVTTGSEIGRYVQEQVTTYPNSTQTPDFGTLELDDRGELLVQLSGPSPRSPDHDAASPAPASEDRIGETAERSPDSDRAPTPTGRRDPRRDFWSKYRSAARVVRGLLLFLLGIVLVYAAVRVLRREATPQASEQVTSTGLGGTLSDDGVAVSSPPDAFGASEAAAAAPTEIHAAPTIDAGVKPGSPRTSIPDAMVLQPQTRFRQSPPPGAPDATAKLEQAEKLRRSNQPRKAITIASALEHDTVYWEASYRIMAMAHCQLHNTEAAKALYQRLAKKAQAHVLSHCLQFGIEF
jgi:uncharacterized caspase-like protein